MNQSVSACGPDGTGRLHAFLVEAFFALYPPSGVELELDDKSSTPAFLDDTFLVEVFFAFCPLSGVEPGVEPIAFLSVIFFGAITTYSPVRAFAYSIFIYPMLMFGILKIYI